jgi:aerobic-type carbon monoxide dehydrogenase small subunit (CoxS/CutS family)
MLKLSINGKTHVVAVAPDTPLLWVLRDELGLTGTKYGCGKGLCGACTVHVDGRAVRSCQLPVAELANKSVLTIEGISARGDHPIQQAWIAAQASQCGYCQPGQIMTALALLQRNPHPSDADIKATMAGNLCRCASYLQILAAIRLAAGEGG